MWCCVGVFWGGRNSRGKSAVVHAWGGWSLPARGSWKLFLGADPSGATSAAPGGTRVSGVPPPGWRTERSGEPRGGPQRGCTQGTVGVQAGCGRGVGPSPRSGLQAEPPRGPAGRRAPCVVSPPVGVVSCPVSSRPVPSPGRLAGPFPGGRPTIGGRPFPTAHLGTSLGPPRSGSFSHFTSH